MLGTYMEHPRQLTSQIASLGNHQFADVIIEMRCYSRICSLLKFCSQLTFFLVNVCYLQKFLLGGRLIFGPDAKSLIITFTLILVPVVIFCVFVASNLAHKFTAGSIGYAILVLAVVFTIYVSFLTLYFIWPVIFFSYAGQSSGITYFLLTFISRTLLVTFCLCFCKHPQSVHLFSLCLFSCP